MKRFLIALFMAAPVLSFGQSNFKPGYVVTNSRDTLKGYVDFRERSVSQATIDFRASLDKPTRRYSLEDCMGYGVDGEVNYRRYVVDLSMSNVDVSKLSTGLDTTVRRDTVFLKILQEGKNISLFSYEDNLKDHFYIMDRDELEPVELNRNLYYKVGSSTKVINDKRYARQLIAKMKKYNPDAPISERAIFSLQYIERSLLKVVSTINDTKMDRPKYKVSRLFLGAAMGISNAKYGGIHVLANSDAKSKSSFAPMLNAGIDVFANPAIGKLMFRMELSLMMNKYKVSLASKDGNALVGSNTFDRSSIALSPQVIYNLYHTDQLKAFVGLGFGFNLSSTSNNKTLFTNPVDQKVSLLTNDVVLEPFNYSFLFKTGVVLNKKIELFAGYSPYSSITDYMRFNVVVQRVQLGVNYLFGKH